MDIRELIETAYRKPARRIALHVLFWLAILLSNFYAGTISFNNFNDLNISFLQALKTTFSLMVFYYPLVYYAFPFLFMKRKYSKGIFFLLALFIVYGLTDAAGDKLVLTGCTPCMESFKTTNPGFRQFLSMPVMNMFFAKASSLGLLYQLVIFLSLPVAVKAGISSYRQAYRQLQLSRENLQLEFNLLKAQVNPHFLFNTLNNIYSLIESDRSKEAGKTLLRLSHFLRHSLYGSGEDLVPLQQEINLLKDYIELEKIRLNYQNVSFQFHSDDSNAKVPPLLFVPALENAFKYLDDNQKDCYIRIAIGVEKNLLKCAIENSFDPLKTGGGGIGLRNMKKRLQHFSGGEHSFSVTCNGNIHLLNLSFHLP